MTAIEKFNEKINAFEKQKKELIKSLKKDLKEIAKEIFTTIPEIKAIYWIQYTPYFNDGDACNFRMNDILVSNCVDDFPDYPDDVYGYIDEEETKPLWAAYANSPGKHIKNAEHKQLIKNFAKALYQSEEFMEEIFGNNVRVIATKKGFKFEDYSDHD